MNAPATTDQTANPVQSFRNFLEKNKAQIAAALPAHLTPDRMIRLSCTEFAKNKQLQQCNPITVFGSIIQASQLGLEIGVMGQAYLVPFKNRKTNQYECQLIPGYKGLIGLARRSGEVTSIETHIVYEKDEFDLVLGMETQLKHVPYLEGDRGNPRIVYGIAKFKDGGHHFEWMSITEVNKIRARSKASDSGPWVTDYDQMVRKTLVRRMTNYLPMSIELANAITLADAAEAGKRATLDGNFVVVDEDDEDETPQAQAQPQPKALPFMPESEFSKDLTKWRGMIASGKKSADEIIAMVQSRASLSDEQIQAIREPFPDQNAPDPQPAVSYAKVAEALNKAKDLDVLDVAADYIREVKDPQQQEELREIYQARRAALSQ